MHPPFVSTAPGGQPPSPALRQAVHRAQRGFLAVNAVPLAAGLLLFPFTTVASVRVAGDLTLGMAWAIAQCGLFAGSAWWYEIRSARVCDPLEDSPTSGGARAGTAWPAGAFDRQGW
ncbi:hypothetical protein ABZY16_00160 [Streptomyces sp. NPDC006553]|uniref:hypothetical protein n=1 Tax=unclassified Streptomyces TaxID=2593676 RepID=UPI00225AE1EB|nr:hypothetical protein [Streptomyces sp. NBC_00233]MCX5230931.1 hypothetical protein [Streptomyces sp. NBC_00233]